jgi:purine nucleoside permease
VLSLVFLFPACTNWRATTQAPETTQVIRPKVVIVVYFEVGKDTGDMPGEPQFWAERDHLDRVIDVPGMSRSVRANLDGSEIAVTVGPGNIRPGVNLMALGMGSQFDLRKSYWLLNGIAGISPADGTVGSAVWTHFVVNRDLTKKIDPSETPTGWPDGFLSLDGQLSRMPRVQQDGKTMFAGGAEARANRRGNVIRMNRDLLRWAYGLTKDVALPEDAPMKALRLRYKGTTGQKCSAFFLGQVIDSHSLTSQKQAICRSSFWSRSAAWELGRNHFIGAVVIFDFAFSFFTRSFLTQSHRQRCQPGKTAKLHCFDGGAWDNDDCRVCLQTFIQHVHRSQM